METDRGVNIVMAHEKFQVTGMTCSACAAHVEKSVSKLNGVKNCTVNLLSNSMTVDFSSDLVSVSDILHAVESGGYHASLILSKKSDRTAPSAPEDAVAGELKNMKFRLILSLVFLIPLFYISMGHMMGAPLPSFLTGHANALTFAFTQFLLILPIVFVNFKYFQVGFKTLFKGSPNMDSLIAIGSAAAIVYGIFAIYQIGIGLGHQNMEQVHQYTMDLYFESAGMILTLITLGKYLETRAKGKTSEAITKLMNLAPKIALVIREGEELEIPSEEVVLGDIIVIKPGKTIPVDGIIVEGQTAVDEAAITGESIPVEKGAGDTVIGATVNKAGYFRMKATKVGEDTTLSQIIRLVEEAGSSKAPIAKLADRVSGVFVPIVIAIAVVAVIAWLLVGKSFAFSLSIGIAVLVISCPCALGLATPTAIMVGTGKGAQNGILIKSAEALEILHGINTIVFDKTGTLTEGKPIVTDIVTVEGVSEEELLKIAASLENASEHPLAEAIMHRADSANIQPDSLNYFESVTGRGIIGAIAGKKFFAGNRMMLTENQISMNLPENVVSDFAEQGKTPLFFADEQKTIGVIAVKDTLKPSSKTAVSELKHMGIATVMLTGDHSKTANAIKKEVEIDEVFAEVLPQQKEQKIRQLQESGKKVAMVGDGINDSPALARADVGIAIGAGTDVAIESADVILMKNDLLDAVAAVQLSKATIRNIKENLFWALIYNTIGIPLAAGVFFSMLGWKLNPMFAAAAMSLSSVCVVSNALRLKLFHPKYRTVSQEHNAKQPVIPNVMNIKEDTIMEKEMFIEGMSCNHCKGRVETALNGIDGVHAEVCLEEKKAVLQLSHPVEDEMLVKAVTDAGYEVVGIK